MVLEVKSICCMESLKKIPEVFGLENDNNNWLSAVQYSLSTSSGTLVFAYETKIIVLSNKWDSRSHQSRYSITWSDELPLYDNITSILCLPLSSEASDIVAIILIGFNSGKFQLMTTRGHIFISQQWYAEPVQSIQLPSDKQNTIDEIYVMYQTCVCILQCKQLLQSIRNTDKLSKTNDLLGSISCRVWKYGDSYGGRSETVTSGAVVGSKNIGLFDHLLAASYEGGFNAKYRSSAPQQLAVLSVGIKPFAAFYFAKKVIVQPLVSVAIAQAVASTVKNALPSWLTGAPKVPISNEPMPTISTESMILRYGFYDDHRTGNRIWLSPNNKLAAVADSLGRVLLFDCEQNVITRVWKGCRDAQCSFMKVDEKMSRNADRSKRKHALFLAIYSPKRSTVDIWNVERGKKLASFPAGQNGQLIQQYSHMNASHATSSSMRSNSVAAFFLNPADLTMKELTIPFHYTLDISSNKKSKDLHIINQIKADLKCCESEEEKNCIIDLCSSIQTNEMRFKCIHALVKNRYLTPEIFSLILCTFLKTVEMNSEIDRSDLDGGSSSKDTHNDVYSDMKLSKFLRKYERLLLFYNGMKQKSSQNDSNDSDDINDCDFDDILKVVDQYKLCLNLKKAPKVSIQCSIQTNNNFIEYLSIFDCNSSDKICLNQTRSNRFAGVGFDLFDSFIQQTINFDSFYKLAAISSLSNIDLLNLFLHYWTEKNIRYNDTNEVIRHLVSFTQIVQIICDLDRASAEHNYGALSPWWQHIREMLLSNSSVFKSLLAAMLCRDLSVLYRQKEAQDSTADEGVWEQVSQEIAQWSLLIGKLDDIAALSSILSFKPIQPNRKQENTHDVVPLEYTIPDISLISILNGGNGIVVKLVAKWIASTSVKPNVFFTATEGEEVTENFLPNQSVSYLELLRKHFPFSLRSGVLLCQLAWEYASAWNNNVEKMELLATSIVYLHLFDESDFALKHGICCIIWNTFFQKHIRTSMKLVNQIGKSSSSLDDPKNSSGILDSMIPDFVLHCNKYVEHMMASRDSPTVIVKFEELLQDGPEPALATRATKHSKANMKLIELHQQLLDVFLIFTSLNVSTKYSLNSLFNESSKAYLACDICAEPNQSILRIDDSVIKSRKHFLHRAINASIDLIRKDFHEIYLTDFNHWMDQILTLGKRWTINSEDLIKYQIIQLYTRGWDDCAEKKLTKKFQTTAMGKTLTSITATRLNLFVREKPELYSRVLSIGSRLNAFLETLDESSIKLPPQCEELEDMMFVEKLQRLARKAYECFTEQDSSDLKLTAHLFDACVEVRDYLNSAPTK